MLADDLGWKDLGCTGSTFYETPNLDRLAAKGARFTQAYSACQVCSPTRAAIYTGKFPARTGITDFIGAAQPERWKRATRMLPASYKTNLDLEEVTVAEAFKEAGYKTFFAGKWHLGEEPYWPEHQGFDVNRGGGRAGHPPSYFSPYKLPNLPDGPNGEHLPARLAEETRQFIEANAKGPFLVVLSFYSVHTPLMCPPELEEKYKKKAARLGAEEWGQEGERKVRLTQSHAVYAGMIESMDTAAGVVLDTLDRLKLSDNTLVIFTSDNGGLSTSEGSPTSNAPLRGGKGWFYEGGIRVPLLMRFPSTIPAGSKFDAPVISTDLYPTFLELAGLALRPKQHVDGLSVAPLFRGKAKLDRDALYWHYPHYGNQGGFPGSAMRAGDWKLIQRAEENAYELYNLRNDPSETKNLSQQEARRTKRLAARLKEWQQDVGAKFPSPKPETAKEPSP
jgi:arylsulfatase A-like enzyme